MPDDATEHEIALLGIPFGLLENMVLSKKANQVSILKISIPFDRLCWKCNA